MTSFGLIRTRRFTALLLSSLAVGLALLAAGWAGGAGASPAADPTAQGKALVQRFFTLLHNQDRSGLNALLAPNFQVVRANGGVQSKASYLANPPKVDKFTIVKLKATESAGVLVVSYQVAVAETINGREQPTGRAPRLSVFHEQNGVWRLVAHANFGAISR